MFAAATNTEYLGLNELRQRDPLFDGSDTMMKRYEMIREYRATKRSAERVGKRYGCATSTVLYWVKRFEEKGMPGLVGEKPGPKGPYKITDEVKARILQLRAEMDFTITEISKALHEEGTSVGPTAVDRVLTENGVPKKKRGPKPKAQKPPG